MRNYLWSHRVVWSCENTTIPMPNIYLIGWYLFDAPTRFSDDINMPAASYRYFSDDRVRDSTVLSENSRQISVWEPSLSPSWRERGTISTPAVEWRGRLGSGRAKKESFFFSQKLSPREKQLFPACQPRSPKYSPARRRSSIEQQTIATPATEEEADLFVGNALEFSLLRPEYIGEGGVDLRVVE